MARALACAALLVLGGCILRVGDDGGEGGTNGSGSGGTSNPGGNGSGGGGDKGTANGDISGGGVPGDGDPAGNGNSGGDPGAGDPAGNGNSDGGTANGGGGGGGNGGGGGGNGGGNGAVDMAAPPDLAHPDLLPPPDLGGVLNASISDPTGVVSLSQQGTLDWVHWGLWSEVSVDRKAGITPLISDVKMIGTGPFHQYQDNHITYTWTGGAPDATSNGTITGIFILGEGNGFQLTAPADPTVRHLKIYLSAFGADCRITAHISDGSALDWVYTIQGNATKIGVYRLFSITYKTLHPGETLTVTWTDVKDYFPKGGGSNVTLQAATLQ